MQFIFETRSGLRYKVIASWNGQVATVRVAQIPIHKCIQPIDSDPDMVFLQVKRECGAIPAAMVEAAMKAITG